MYTFNEFEKKEMLTNSLPTQFICVISGCPETADSSKEEMVNRINEYLLKASRKFAPSIQCGLLFFQDNNMCSIKSNCTMIDQKDISRASLPKISDNCLYDSFNERVLLALSSLQNEIRSNEEAEIQTFYHSIILLVDQETAHLSKQVSDCLRHCLLFERYRLLVAPLDNACADFLKDNNLEMCKRAYVLENVDDLLVCLEHVYPLWKIYSPPKRLSDKIIIADIPSNISSIDLNLWLEETEDV